ncbi:hypothetical protein [Phocaeicola sp. HCN-6420]|uniref:hypothetical protein n=1 Tax=Phocaeicola sp. HCN-6420 TaxID=3134673 RepID=UPI0030C40A8C
MKQLQLIEELPDLKIGWYESYKCLDEPLLEYVWEVANHFLPDYEDVSSAPAIFANRYAERNLSDEERYERAKEMKTFKGTLEEYKKREYRKLDDSFKEKFLSNEDLQNTIEAYKLDVSKFWYLLLFVYDFIEDIGTNAPIMGKSVLEDFATFLTKLCDASSITLKQGNKKSYYTEREDLINIIQIAIHHFSKSYTKIINSNKDRETKIKQLKEIGLKGFIDNSLLSKMDFKEKFSLDISHKKWKFTDMFLFFIENRKATTIPNKKVKVSKDKMILISRLIYTVGYDGKRYNEEYDSENNKNRMLSNLLRRYKNEKFPSVIANNYMVIS